MALTHVPGTFRTDTLVAAGTVVNANGNSGTFGAYESAKELVIHIVATAIGGTPSLVVNLQDSVDGTNWATVASAAAITATGTTALRIPITTPFAGTLRLNYVITGGTPSVTLGVFAYASRAN